MIYSEFLEATAAMAVHKLSDPFIPLVQRVEQFIKSNLLKGSKAK